MSNYHVTKKKAKTAGTLKKKERKKHPTLLTRKKKGETLAKKFATVSVGG